MNVVNVMTSPQMRARELACTRREAGARRVDGPERQHVHRSRRAAEQQ